MKLLRQLYNDWWLIYKKFNHRQLLGAAALSVLLGVLAEMAVHPSMNSPSSITSVGIVIGIALFFAAYRRYGSGGERRRFLRGKFKKKRKNLRQ